MARKPRATKRRRSRVPRRITHRRLIRTTRRRPPALAEGGIGVSAAGRRKLKVFVTCEKCRFFVGTSLHARTRSETLSAQVQILPASGQALEATLRQANAAAGVLSDVAWERRTFWHYDLHRIAYHDVRDSSGLAAQVVVRLIAKVCDADKEDREAKREFKPLGGVVCDALILRWFPDANIVSIWTVAGRQVITFVCGAHQAKMLSRQRGESDLVLRDGKWFLYASVAVAEGESNGATDVLRVDLGIVNIAYHSDCKRYTGAGVNSLRHRHRRLRRKSQKKGTNAAKRLLKMPAQGVEIRPG